MPQAAIAVAAGAASNAIGWTSVYAWAAQIALIVVTSSIQKSMAESELANQTPPPIKGMVRSSSEPFKTIYGTRRVSGPLVYWKAGGDKLCLVVALCRHKLDGITEYYFDNDAMTDIVGFFGAVGKKAISTDFRDGSLVQTVMPLVNNFGEPWSVNHIGNGIAYIACDLQDYKQWASIPNFSAIARGKPIYDPRKDDSRPSYYTGGVGTHRLSDDTTWEYSSNPSLIARDYITSYQGFSVASQRIDEDYVVWSADQCDLQVAVPAPVNLQNKYECHIALSTSTSLQSNLNKISATMAGTVLLVGGLWRIKAGGYEEPTATIIEDDIVSEYNITSKLPKRLLYNYVTGIFYDEEKNWQASNFIPISNSVFEIRDGKRIPIDIILEGVKDKYQAQRLAIIKSHQSAMQVSVSFVGKPKLYDIAVGDLIYHTTSNPVWTQKLFRVLRWELQQDMKILLNLREEFGTGADDGTYDVAVGEYILHNGYTGTGVYNPNAVPDTTGFAFFTGDDADYTTHSDGTIITGAKLTWDANPDVFFRHHVVSFRVAGGLPDENPWTDINITGNATAAFIPLPTTITSGGDIYDFKIYAVNELGKENQNPQQLDDRIVIDKTLVPDQAGAITSTPMMGGANVILDTLGVNDNDLQTIQYGFSQINDATGIVDIYEVPCPRDFATIDAYQNGVQFPVNSYMWARFKNTVGLVGQWNTADLNGTLLVGNRDVDNVFGILGRNFISPIHRGDVLYLSGSTTLLGPSGKGVPLGQVGLEVGDPISLGLKRVSVTETTGGLTVILRDLSFVEIERHTAPFTLDKPPSSVTRVQTSNLNKTIPANVVHIEVEITVTGGDMSASVPSVNRGEQLFSSFGGFLDGMLDPTNETFDWGEAGDFENLLDGNVESANDNVPSTGVGGGGGPGLAPGETGGGYFETP